MGRKLTVSSKFYCINCGREGIPIMRKKGQQRSGGHLKNLYCPWCKEEFNHVEIKSMDDLEKFQTDYAEGKFLEDIENWRKEKAECLKEKCQRFTILKEI